MTAPRLLTGDRPTGRLHLGHYVGSLVNRIALQDRYECYFIVADLHTLTTRNSREDIAAITGYARDMVLDSIAAGIDPDRATFYLQSAIGETGDLNTLLANLVTVPRLARIPSLREMARAAHADEMPYGLLGYPVLQTADILGVRAHAVPVGKDNVAHVEVTREIARRFNTMYGDVFPVPSLVAAATPTLVGTDGRAKMSKSLDNTIALADDPATVRRKVMRMYTDPNRTRADIPGTVEGNPVFAYHRIFNPDTALVTDLEQRYRAGTVGDVEVKEELVAALDGFLAPMRERRAEFAARPGLVDRLLVDGTERTRVLVRDTVADVRRAMGLTGVYTRLRRKAARTP